MRGEKRRRILSLRGRGYSYAEIAQRVGMTRSAVWKVCNPEATQAMNTRDNAKRLHECSTDGCANQTRRDHCIDCEIAKSKAEAVVGPELVRLWAEGKLVREIAVEMAYSVAGVCSRIDTYRRLGYDLPHRHAERADGATARRRKTIMQRWKQGRTAAEIAEELGTTTGSVSQSLYYLRKLGYDLPYRVKVAA